MKNNHLLIFRLQKIIDTILRPHIPSHGKIALLDFPNYANVGDSAIWLGQIRYFLNYHHIKPLYVSHQHGFNLGEMHDAIGTDGVIFISGGGNFGDLWPSHQVFREYIIQNFPANKIVQLPQSIHFDSSMALKRAADIINAHPDFTLIVRDHTSLKIAQDNFKCKVELCPDMAYCLGVLERPIKAIYPLVMLMRTDKERSAISAVQKDALIADWLDDNKNLPPSRFERARNILSSFMPFAPDMHQRRLFDFQRLAISRLNRGLMLLSSGERVVTDRLHAYILSALLNIPCDPLDNNYGKISSFIDTWAEHSEIKLDEIGTVAV